MDPYNNPDQQSDTTIEAMVTRLEERGRHPVFAGMIGAYVAQVPAEVPLRVLDLGSGTGVVARAFEARLHPDSVLVGADVSQRLLDAAGALSPGSRIHWRKINAGGLPFGDAEFDVIAMHTLLSHVAAPETLLREAHRVGHGQRANLAGLHMGNRGRRRRENRHDLPAQQIGHGRCAAFVGDMNHLHVRHHAK